MKDIMQYYTVYDISSILQNVEIEEQQQLDRCNTYYDVVKQTYCIDNFPGIKAEIISHFDNFSFDINNLKINLGKLEKLYDSMRYVELRKHISKEYMKTINDYYSAVTFDKIDNAINTIYAIIVEINKKSDNILQRRKKMPIFIIVIILFVIYMVYLFLNE